MQCFTLLYRCEKTAGRVLPGVIPGALLTALTAMTFRRVYWPTLPWAISDFNCPSRICRWLSDSESIPSRSGHVMQSKFHSSRYLSRKLIGFGGAEQGVVVGVPECFQRIAVTFDSDFAEVLVTGKFHPDIARIAGNGTLKLQRGHTTRQGQAEAGKQAGQSGAEG